MFKGSCRKAGVLAGLLALASAGSATAQEATRSAYAKETSTDTLAELVDYRGGHVRSRHLTVIASVAGDRLTELRLGGASGCTVELAPDGQPSGVEFVIRAAPSGDCALINGAAMTPEIASDSVVLKFFHGSIVLR